MSSKLMRALWLSIMVCAGSAFASSASASCSSSEYDVQIAVAVARWMPDLDLIEGARQWKAQLCAESGLDPMAVSPVKAQGMAQFMPGTWAEESVAAGHAGQSAFNAEAAIDTGAFYMGKLRRFWGAVADPDRHWLAQGSYNAGPGNIRKAVRYCGGDARWSVVVKCLSQITGDHADETIGYVSRIKLIAARLRQ